MRTVVLLAATHYHNDAVHSVLVLTTGDPLAPVLCCNDRNYICNDHCAAFEIEDDRHVRCNFAGAEIGVLAEKEG